MISVILYCLLNKYYNIGFEKKIAYNYLSLTHAFLCILFYYVSFNYFRFNSIGYFIYDSIYILNEKKINIVNICYIYHHLILSYILFLKIDEISFVLMLGEISNIPTYIVYHLIQIKDYENKEIWLIIQTLTYISIRVFAFTHILLMSNINDWYMKHLYVIYSFGLIWSYKILNN
mgnify:CR=1 FL=1|tara:strand:+ start:74 stop:598 length:525 start_codon:yes stop_codon:yes gene_type:complete